MPESDPEIDEPMIHVPEERGRPEPESEDPMRLVQGEVPLYNPLSMPLDPQYAGRFYRLAARCVTFVPSDVAEAYVGPDNLGGTASRLGLRRLYGPEPRFEAAAKNRGLTLEELVQKMNEKIRREADAAAAAYESTLSAEAEELESSVAADQGR